MKNSLLISMAMMCICGNAAFAQMLSPEEALSRINNDNTNFRHQIKGTLSSSRTPLLTVKDGADCPALYVFSRSEGEGFVIASAEAEASPMLGYSDTGVLETDNLPPQLSWWLRQYAAEIGAARMKKNATSAASSGNLPTGVVNPLVKTKWNQGEPYNDYAYYLKSDTDSVKSVTGCVATAMAQIMYYWQYPAQGTGKISYTHGSSGTYSMDFAARPFDWKEMRDTYYPGTYTAEEGEAVAYLMKACGYSVKMDYGMGESGASGTAPATALTQYFGYSKGITVQSRAWWTYDEWVEMLYQNLTEVGPIIYNGSALDGGHSFVCDGYDGNGYFHFNWGWGGMADGYYLLDALNPDEYGIGGAAGGYNLDQQVILGITPDTTAESPIRQFMQFGNLKGVLDGHTLTLELTDTDNPGMQYIDPEDVDVTFGLIVEDADAASASGTASQTFKADKTETADMGSFYHWDEVGRSLDLESVDMTEGESYNVYIATYINGEWSKTVAKPGDYNYVTVTRTASGYELQNHTAADLTVADFKIESDTVYQDLPVEFSATFTNSSASQLTRNYSAVFFNSEGEEQFKTENAGVTVDPESSLSHTWTSVQWYAEDGAGKLTEQTTYTVKLYDNWTGRYVDGVETTVTVQPEPADKKVEATLSLPGLEAIDGVYTITGRELEVSMTVKVESGYFSQPINLDVEVPTDDSYYSVQSQRFDAIPALSEGEEQTLTMSITIDNPVEGQRYRLQAWSGGDTLGKPLTVVFTDIETGVAFVEADAPAVFTVYSLDGVMVLKNASAEALKALPRGIYIVNGLKLAL